MDGITVASTTDTMEDVNSAAGVEETEQPKPVVTEEPQKQEAKPEVSQDPSPSKKAQKRIDLLTRKLYEAEAKNAELEAKVAPLSESEPQATSGQPQWSPTKPEPQQEQFQSTGDYISARVAWEIEQRDAKQAYEQAQQAENERIQARDASWNKQYAAALEKYHDFEDVLRTDVPMQQYLLDAIKELDNGAEVVYWLGNNLEQAKELHKMPGLKAIARLGRISAELGNGESFSEKPTSEIAEEEAEEEEPRPKKKAISAAPAPIRPVGGSSTKSSVPMDELDYATYRKLRDQQAKARYRK